MAGGPVGDTPAKPLGPGRGLASGRRERPQKDGPVSPVHPTPTEDRQDPFVETPRIRFCAQTFPRAGTAAVEAVSFLSGRLQMRHLEGETRSQPLGGRWSRPAAHTREGDMTAHPCRSRARGCVR